MENAGRQRRVGPAFLQRGAQVLEIARASARDNRNADGVRDTPGQFDVVARFRAVGVHAGQQDFARAAALHLFGPGHRLQRGRAAPVPAAMALHDIPAVLALRVDRHHDALRTETRRRLVHEIRILDGRRVDRDLVRTRVEHAADVFNRADAAPDAQRHEDLLGGAPHHIEHGVPVVGRGADVEKHQFVGLLLVIALRYLDRVARVAQAEGLDTFHNAAVGHIQAWNNAFG